ncbi:outer membrane protein [Bartonella apis]|uniref:outer membrane protein n=1 Tax=Bartonella apis TaxID=1686310 RepID=UPI0024331110|nr:outer membrane protein [Bartonella apis]
MINRFTYVVPFLLAASAAQAADVVVNQEPAPVVAAPAFSWSGFYAGGQIGGSWGDGSFERDVKAVKNLRPAKYGDARISDVKKKSIDGGDFIGGVYAGYNLQFTNNIVAGFDADFTWLDNTAKSNENIPFGESRIDGYRNKVKQDWMAAVRARLGYAYDRFLPYIAGGVAFTDVEYKHRYYGDVTDIWFDERSSSSKTLTGYTLGAGLDYAMTDHIILRAEYRYTDFGDKDFILDYQKRNVETKSNDVRFGVAYKFN